MENELASLTLNDHQLLHVMLHSPRIPLLNGIGRDLRLRVQFTDLPAQISLPHLV